MCPAMSKRNGEEIVLRRDNTTSREIKSGVAMIKDIYGISVRLECANTNNIPCYKDLNSNPFFFLFVETI